MGDLRSAFQPVFLFCGWRWLRRFPGEAVPRFCKIAARFVGDGDGSRVFALADFRQPFKPNHGAKPGRAFPAFHRFYRGGIFQRTAFFGLAAPRFELAGRGFVHRLFDASTGLAGFKSFAFQVGRFFFFLGLGVGLAFGFLG